MGGVLDANQFQDVFTILEMDLSKSSVSHSIYLQLLVPTKLGKHI